MGPAITSEVRLPCVCLGSCASFRCRRCGMSRRIHIAERRNGAASLLSSAGAVSARAGSGSRGAVNLWRVEVHFAGVALAQKIDVSGMGTAHIAFCVALAQAARPVLVGPPFSRGYVPDARSPLGCMGMTAYPTSPAGSVLGDRPCPYLHAFAYSVREASR